MTVSIHFYSYFKDLTGCAETTASVADGATLKDLFQTLLAHYPKLADMQKCALFAVDVEYQPRHYVLKAGDEVSLFPPVQGG